MTTTVKVYIHDKERMLGAMVKALSFEVGGASSVKGVSFPILEATSHYTFTFASESHAQEFKDAVRKYLPAYLARVVEDA